MFLTANETADRKKRLTFNTLIVTFTVRTLSPLLQAQNTQLVLTALRRWQPPVPTGDLRLWSSKTFSPESAICSHTSPFHRKQKLLSSLTALSKLRGGALRRAAHYDISPPPSLKNPISMTIRAWIQRRRERGKPHHHCIAGSSLRLMVLERIEGERKRKPVFSVVVVGDSVAAAARPNSFLAAGSDSGPTFSQSI